MDVTKLTTDILRNILWVLCQGLFFVIDLVYSVIHELISLNLYNFDFIWSIYIAFTSLIFIFIIIRVILQFVQAIYDEDIIERVEPITIIIRLFIISVITVVLPLTLKNLSSFSSDMTGNINTFITTSSGISTPSDIFMDSVLSDNLKGTYTIKFNEIKDINIQENGNYVYFKQTYEMLFTGTMALFGSVIFLFVGLQISQRWFGFLMKICISPYSLSGVVIEKNDEFNTWFKLVIGDLLSGFFQVVLVYLVFVTVSYIQIHPVAKIIFFLGGLMSIMNAPSGIAQLLGGDIGTGTALQQLQSTAMLGSALNLAGNLAGGVVGGVSSKIKTGFAGGLYGTGRMLGGNSLSNNFIGGMDGANSTNNVSTTSNLNVNSGNSGWNNRGVSESLGTYSQSNSVNSGLTREGSFANKIGNKLEEKGIVGRLTKKGAEKLYTSSANQLFRDRTRKDGSLRHSTANNIVRARNFINQETSNKERKLNGKL